MKCGLKELTFGFQLRCISTGRTGFLALQKVELESIWLDATSI
jgi:hypothetical protein